jgi:hypothetical protein
LFCFVLLTSASCFVHTLVSQTQSLNINAQIKRYHFVVPMTFLLLVPAAVH